MTDYKRLVKRIMIYFLLLIPILLGIAFLLEDVFAVPMWLNIFVNVLVGIICVGIFEFVYQKNKAKKEKEKLSKPKRKDPFAD